MALLFIQRPNYFEQGKTKFLTPAYPNIIGRSGEKPCGNLRTGSVLFYLAAILEVEENPGD